MSDNSTISPLPLGRGPGVRATSGRKAPNSYLQVALTYLRRPFSSPQGLALSALFLVMCIGFFPILLSGDRHDITAAPIQIEMPLMLAMFLFWMFAIHAKNQFADSRAHLMPGFRRVHATVAAAVALLLTFVLPVVLIWLADLHSVGLVALMVFLFARIRREHVFRLFDFCKEQLRLIRPRCSNGSWPVLFDLGQMVQTKGGEHGIIAHAPMP